MSRGRSNLNSHRGAGVPGWMASFSRACDAFLLSRGEVKWTRAEVVKRSVMEAGRQRQRRGDRADATARELEEGWEELEGC